MPLVIPDDVLQSAGLSEAEAKVEIACRLFDAQRIGKGLAARLAGLSRDEFDGELVARGLPLIRYTEQMLNDDLATLDYLRHAREPQHADRR